MDYWITQTIEAGSFAWLDEKITFILLPWKNHKLDPLWHAAIHHLHSAPLFPSLISLSLCASVHFPLYCLLYPPFLAYHSIKVKQCGCLNEVTVMILLKVTTQHSSVLANMFILQCHQWQGHTAPFLLLLLLCLKQLCLTMMLSFSPLSFLCLMFRWHSWIHDKTEVIYLWKCLKHVVLMYQINKWKPSCWLHI